MQRKLLRNVKIGRIMGVACVEKTFADGGKISKFMKVFSLESFPLYGNRLKHQKVSYSKKVDLWGPLVPVILWYILLTICNVHYSSCMYL